MSSNENYGTRYMAFLYALSFIVIVVILFTDRNLQTDFGSVQPYFYHWFGLLATGIIDLIGVFILVLKPGRRVVLTSLSVSIIMVVFLLADTLAYSSVGFSTLQSFATYLFGVTRYQGNMNYIPGLYDILLALYVVNFLIALFYLRKISRPHKS